MNKNIFIISDVELGQGDIFDDFKDERVLIDFIEKITKQPGKNILIMNGDTFDFLKMPYKGNFTHHITEEQSLWKMQRIIETYPKIFLALKKFLNKPANKIHFNIGNHDIELVWPQVQKYLRQELGNGNKVTFDHTFENKEIHVEHGNQVDYFYKMDLEKPFIKHKGQTLLNLPLGNVAVIKYFIELKRHFPYEEKVYPRHNAFENFPEFRKMKRKISVSFAIKGLLFSFITGLGDPIISVPYLNLIKHVFSHGLELHDEAKFIKKRFKNIIKLYPGKQSYIMGHVHLTHYELNPKKDHLQVVTDTWREEFRIMHDKVKILKPKTYVHIKYQGDKIEKIDLKTFA